MQTGKQLGCVLMLVGAAVWSAAASADVYTFNFTGRMTVADSTGNVLNSGEPDFNGYQSPISAALTYDTVTGLGTSPLTITLDSVFMGSPATFHDITLARIGTSNLFDGQLLADWGGALDLAAHIEWDASGLMYAIDSGLMQVGDKISGDVLMRDPSGDHSFSEVVIGSLGSAVPYTDSLILGKGVAPQYYAPLAATSGTLGLAEGTGLNGIRIYLDIGSGNSMYLTSVTAVPEPASWAFLLSGLCLVGWAARQRREVTVRIQ